MYKVLNLMTGEEVQKPFNKRGNYMTIKQARRFLKSGKAYVVRDTRHNYGDINMYFTSEPEYQDTHPNYNAEFTQYMGKVKIPLYLISIVRVYE